MEPGAKSPSSSPAEEAASPISEFFEGRHVFVTGATGFMGKVLVEKLLRSCPRIGCIYLLMRDKRGKEAGVRHREYVNHVIFDRLRAERPDFASQLRPVSGDVQLDGLGLTAADHAHLLRHTQVVFHCAANVRFDQPLGAMVNLNTGGALRMLELARQMTELKAYVHVSTSYCHCHLDVLEEKTYPAVHDPRKVMALLEWMDEKVVQTMTPLLIGELPNTYAYSKNLSEQLVAEYATKFPIGIARPSIVTGSWREPIPGWVENLNGPVGLLVAAGKGVLRSMHCKPDYHADLVPVDIAINIVIALAWRVGTTRPTGAPLVVNVTESGANPITWNEIVEAGRSHLHDYPFTQCVWYPNGSIKSSKLAHNFAVVFYHFLPAYLIDGAMRLCGQKTFMVNVQRRIHDGLVMLQYYTTKKWRFENARQVALRESMSPADKETFYSDIKAVDWEAYSRASVYGTRKYCLNEDPATIPAAKRHLARLKLLDQTVTVLFYFLLLWILFTCSGYVLGHFDDLLAASSQGVGNVPASKVAAIL